jgi:hypothetical protein
VARAGRSDPKVEALRAARSLNPRPEAVSDEAFSSSEFLDPRDLVQVSTRWCAGSGSTTTQ